MMKKKIIVLLLAIMLGFPLGIMEEFSVITAKRNPSPLNMISLAKPRERKPINN